MSFITLLVGLLSGICMIKCLPVLKKMPWYHMLLGFISYAVFLFGIFFTQVSFMEKEPRAGYMGIALFGSISVALAVAVYLFGYKPAKAKLGEGVK